MRNNFLKIALIVIIFAVFGVYVFINTPEILRTLDTTKSHLTIWIILAFLLSLVSLFAITKATQKSFEVVKIKIPYLRIQRLYLSYLATNTLIPSLGVSGSLVYIEDARENDYKPSSGVVGYILYLLSDLSAISLLLLFSLFYLFYEQDLVAAITIPIILFGMLTAGFFYIVFQAEKGHKHTRLVLGWILRPILYALEVFTGKAPHADRVLNAFFRELGLANKFLKKSPSKLVLAIGWDFLSHTLKIGFLYLIFYSFGYPIDPSVLLVGYMAGAIMVVVSPTPNGIGFTEGAMVLAFDILKVPREISATVTLIYRGFAFWLPFFVGLFISQRTRIRKVRESFAELESEE